MECRVCGSTEFDSKWGFDARTGKQLYKCSGCGGRVVPLGAPEFGASHDSSLTAKNVKGANRYVITAAQNDTAINVDFFDTLVKYCDEKEAVLIVLPVWYRNPDAFHPKEENDDADFDPAVLPYLLTDDFKIGESLVVAGRLHVNATAASPLQGLDDIHGTCSAIYGHPQLQMRMIPTPHGQMPKMLHTTGCVTKKNFSKSKAGQKADFHHSHAALVVEVLGDDRFIVRELSYSEEYECFYDLNRFYSAAGSSESDGVLAIVLGDEHVKFSTQDVKNATFGAGGIIDTLKPDVIVRHDIHDHFSGSHHHENDPILKAMKARDNSDDVEAELDLTVEHLAMTCAKGIKSVIVDSNHHDHLGKWLSNFDARKDPKNAIIAWELFGMLSKALRAGVDPNPFRLFLEDRLGDLARNMTFVTPNDTYMIAGIDVSQHGHIGPNGSRGGPRAFGSTAYKMITGHTHTPGIERGVWTVGTSVATMPYARGYSSWMTTHCVIYKSGKRAMIHIVDGKWRLDDKKAKLAKKPSYR